MLQVCTFASRLKMKVAHYHKVRDQASSQRLSGARHRGVAVQDLETWAKGCVAGAKSGRKAYEVVAVLHPMEPGSTAGDLIVRYLGTQSELRQRIGALL